MAQKSNGRIRKLIADKATLLKKLESEISFWRDNKIKMYTKDLSPACRTCFQGKSIDVNVNHICSRVCFYCPVPVKKDWDPYLALDHIQLKTSQDLVDFVSKFDIETVSFSGGDPLLTFDVLIRYIADLKTAFGSTVYTLVYTNGDGLSEKRAKILKDTGLDEIRINLSARNYDIAPIILAKKYIPRVAVSSPAVPEEYEKMKAALSELDKAGVNNVNIIELMVAPYNKEKMAKRKYLIKPYNAVAESEIAAYKLLDYAIANRIKTPVHFCTASYKALSCRMGRNLRYAKYALKKGESVTATGKIRSVVAGPDGGETRLEYYDTYVAMGSVSGGKKVRINKSTSVTPLRKQSATVPLHDAVDRYLFEGLFVAHTPIQPLIKRISREYPTEDKTKLVERAYLLHAKLKDLEYFGEPTAI